MIQVAPGTKVYLACRPVSMRYGFDGLAAQVAQVLRADPFGGHLFLFPCKRGDYLKSSIGMGPACACSPSGWSRASSSGRRSWMARMMLTPAQLALLVEAIDWRRTVAPEPPRRPVTI